MLPPRSKRLKRRPKSRKNLKVAKQRGAWRMDEADEKKHQRRPFNGGDTTLKWSGVPFEEEKSTILINPPRSGKRE